MGIGTAKLKNWKYAKVCFDTWTLYVVSILRSLYLMRKSQYDAIIWVKYNGDTGTFNSNYTYQETRKLEKAREISRKLEKLCFVL